MYQYAGFAVERISELFVRYYVSDDIKHVILAFLVQYWRDDVEESILQQKSTLAELKWCMISAQLSNITDDWMPTNWPCPTSSVRDEANHASLVPTQL